MELLVLIFDIAGVLLFLWIAFIAISTVLSVVSRNVRYIVAKKRNKRDALKRKEKWWKIEEPLYRESEGYPEDWEIRRAQVCIRENGICEICGGWCGDLTVPDEYIWLGLYYGKIVRGAHVHHKIPISKGGNHSLENLQLLCEDCHEKLHPGNKGLIALRRLNRSRGIRFGSDAKFKAARKLWKCDVCDDDIPPRTKYFGDNFNRVCSNCFHKYYKR